MSEEDDAYCRLCAEITPKHQLISSDEDVSVTSKIPIKMSWINVDISVNSLPNTICFACFDSLERTWKFLHEVRAAQQKLLAIFQPKTQDENGVDIQNKSVSNFQENVGKPVNKDWEVFEASKVEVKEESGVITLEEVPICNLKSEPDSDVDFSNNLRDNSSDSDNMPLLKISNKKKKSKKKNRVKIKYDAELMESCLKEEVDAIPSDMSLINITWTEYNCLCAICNSSYKTIDALREHSLRDHSSCPRYKCSECNKSTSSFQGFVKHARSHYKSLRHFCEYCNMHFSWVSYLSKHINAEHNLTNICTNCGIIFENEKLLGEHVSAYGTAIKMRRKKQKSGNEYYLKCEHCNKEFKSRSNLHQHKLVHSQRSRDFFCHICGKMFFTKGTLSTHMKTHEETKPYKCEFCPLSFRARGNLQSHISLHSGLKPFVCEQCGMSFRVKRHLKSHSIIHTDLMPYVCEFCNKSFRFKTRLNLHLRQHTGAKPYNCAFCQRDFTNGSNFKKHMRRRHNIDTSIRKLNNVFAENEVNRVSIVQT